MSSGLKLNVIILSFFETKFLLLLLFELLLLLSKLLFFFSPSISFKFLTKNEMLLRCLFFVKTLKPEFDLFFGYLILKLILFEFMLMV